MIVLGTSGLLGKNFLETEGEVGVFGGVRILDFATNTVGAAAVKEIRRKRQE